MKNCIIALTCLLGLFVTASSLHASEERQSTANSKHARIHEDVARTAAAERFPDSAFENAELEKEHGRWIWSIHLRPRGSNDVREVEVDAMTGDIVASEIESPEMADDDSRPDEEAQQDR